MVARLKFLAGEYVLDELSLGKLVEDTSPVVEYQSVLDLQDLFTTFSISQSIHSPCMTLDIALGESKQVFEQFGSKGLQGEEFVRMRFQTPTKTSIERIFYVTGYEPVGKTQHDLGHSLVLRCASKEKLINDISTVNRAFKDRNLDEVAKNIFTTDIIGHSEFKALQKGNYGIGFSWGPPNFNVELIDGLQSFIIPGLSPFAAMRFLCRRAFGGSSFKGSMFTFFENSNGYHFVNLENLIKKVIDNDKARKAAVTFTHDSNMSEHSRYSKEFFRNIQVMFPLNTANTLEKIGNGAFSNRVRTIDHVKKSFYDTNFDMQKEYDKINTVGFKFNITDAFYKRFCTSPADFTMIKDTTEHKEDFEHIVGKRKAYMNLLTSFGYNIVVHGDTELNVGDVINLDLIEGGTAENKESSMYAGYYFITDLIHTVDKGKFNTTLALAKDSLDSIHSEAT
jgi:hypothetical protein